MLLPMADGPYLMFMAAQHTLDIDESGISNTILIEQEMLAAPRNTIDVGDEPNAIKSNGANVMNEYQGLEGKIAERKRCDSNNRPTHTTATASKNIYQHEPRDCKELNVNIGTTNIDFCSGSGRQGDTRTSMLQYEITALKTTSTPENTLSSVLCDVRKQIREDERRFMMERIHIQRKHVGTTLAFSESHKCLILAAHQQTYDNHTGVSRQQQLRKMMSN